MSLFGIDLCYDEILEDFFACNGKKIVNNLECLNLDYFSMKLYLFVFLYMGGVFCIFLCLFKIKINCSNNLKFKINKKNYI